MKIIKIGFKNINNLKGEHTINFDEFPLSTASIFAITGPTGSGKSTILDVITLALFKRIPRFSKTITKAEIEDLGSIMTHHTNNSNATITYEIKGNRYTSTWSIDTTRTGNLKDYEMFLYDSSGIPMDLKKSEVPSKNEEIIGLKYDQFIKSIILSQGEFAKFLKADKNERGQLLENITGTSIYRKLGIAAFDKYKSINQTLEKEKEVIGIINVLDEEERASLKIELNELKKRKNNLDNELKTQISLKRTKEEILTSKNQLTQKEGESTRIGKRIKEYQPILDKLILHDKINPLRGDLADYHTAHLKANRTELQLKESKIEEQTAGADLKKVIMGMSDLCNKEVNKQNFKSVMSQFEKRVNELDRDLLNIAENGEKERRIINQKKTSYHINIDDKAQPEAAILILKNRSRQLDTTLKAAELNSNTDVAEIRMKIKKLQGEVSLFKEMQQNFNQIAYSEKMLRAENKKSKTSSDKLKVQHPLLKLEEEHIITLQENYELLLIQKQDAVKIAKFEDLRQELKSNEPCPLCGSTKHPYTAHITHSSSSEIDQKIDDLKTIIKSKNKQAINLREEITQTKSTIHASAERVSEITQELEKINFATQILKGTYSGKEKIDAYTISELFNSTKSSHDKLEVGVKALDERKMNLDLLEGFNRLLAIGVKYKLLNDEKNMLFRGSDVSVICNDLQDRFAKAHTTIEKSKTSIEKETKDLKGAQNVLDSLSAKIQPRIKTMGFESLDDINNHILEEEYVVEIKKEKENLLKSQNSNETQIQTLGKTLLNLAEQDIKPNLELKTLLQNINTNETNREQCTTAIGEKQNQLKRDNEDRVRIKSKEQEIDRLNKELTKWFFMNHLIGSANGDKFANFAQGLTLQNLLVFTNKRLENLSDRYLIDRPTADGALMVIDQYQGNIQRAVSTLSGGETFLISLALALSLSDMASRNVALDCLFIDEGFGTLDSETLDIAMNTLEKLQSESQKMVGVISHVEALKERINVQIQLVKNAQGYSQILVKN